MIRGTVLAGAILLVVCVTLVAIHDAAKGPAIAAPATLTAQHVQQLASLVTTRIEMTAVVARRLDGISGSLRTVIAVRGEVLLGVDLSEASLEEVDVHRCSAVLVVSRPKVLSVSLDHRRTIVHSLTATGTWLLLPPGTGRGELLAIALEEAQRQLAAEASSAPRLEAVCRHAEEAIGHFAKQNFGWRLVVRWV